MGWMHRVRALLRREHLAADLDEELQFHLAMREQLNAQEGMPQDDARSDAIRRFGNPARWKEKMSEIDVFTVPETVWQDVRFAARMLAKHRGFTAVGILALGLGVGVNTAIFTVYKSFLLRPLDASDARQLVNISRTDYQGKYDATFSFADYEAYRDHNQVFSGMIAAAGDEVALSGVGGAPGAGGSMEGRLASAVGFRLPSLMSGGAEFVTASIVSDNYFSVLGVSAVRGRTFRPNDPHKHTSSPGVLVSENYWQRRFRGDPALLGRSVKLNGAAFTVIGITPRDFMGTNLNVPNFWIAIRQWDLLHPGSDIIHDRENACCRLYGRLAPGTRLSEAQAEMNLLADQLRSQHAPHSDASKPMTIQLSSGSPFGPDLEPGLQCRGCADHVRGGNGFTDSLRQPRQSSIGSRGSAAERNGDSPFPGSQSRKTDQTTPHGKRDPGPSRRRRIVVSDMVDPAVAGGGDIGYSACRVGRLCNACCSGYAGVRIRVCSIAPGWPVVRTCTGVGVFETILSSALKEEGAHFSVCDSQVARRAMD